MDVSPAARQYTQSSQRVQRTDDSEQAQNRLVRQQQEAAAKKTSEARPQPVVNGQGQTIGSLVNTTA